MNASRSWGTLADRQVLASPTHDGLKALFAYWRSKAPSGGLPHRKDIVAAEITNLLPNLMIIEPVADGSDWNYRLVGTALAQRYGFDWTGKRLTELLDAATAPGVIQFYCGIAKAGIPGFATGRILTEGREHIVYESGGFPIRGSDGASIWILLGVFFRN